MGTLFGYGKESDVRRRVKKLAVVGADLSGGVAVIAYLQNPEDKDCVIDRLMFNETVASGQTSTNGLDFGVAADAVTGSDNLMDGVSHNAVALNDNIENKGTNGKARQLWAKAGGATDYITVKGMDALNISPLRGTLYIFYVIQD